MQFSNNSISKFSVRYRNRQGHFIEYYPNRRKRKLFVDGWPFSKDTVKNGWVYWRCVGHRKTGFVLFCSF